MDAVLDALSDLESCDRCSGAASDVHDLSEPVGHLGSLPDSDDDHFVQAPSEPAAPSLSHLENLGDILPDDCAPRVADVDAPRAVLPDIGNTSWTGDMYKALRQMPWGLARKQFQCRLRRKETSLENMRFAHRHSALPSLRSGRAHVWQGGSGCKLGPHGSGHGIRTQSLYGSIPVPGH